jgi:pimeloyl-ACP methyl ester carboxylesterase
VENSGPDLSCFPGQHGTRLLFDKDASLPTDVHDPNVLAETWSRAGAIGEWCSKVHSSGNSLARYANTVAVANDMRHYTELLAKSKGEDPLKSQLWYWGVSYGTVLGLTFASLFPNRIGRMILDGVVDADDYYMGKWQSIADADKAVESFFTYCYSAGASNCAFWANSSQAIKTRYNAVIDNLKKRPALVATPGYTDFPTIFRFRDYQTILLQAVYTPDSAFPQLAAGLVALESGHAELIANITGTGIRQDSCKPHAQSDDIEPLPFIAGNDANGRYLLNDYDAWVNHAETLYNQSHYIGEAWALLPVNFRKLNIRAPLSQVFTGTPSAANTSNPILFVSNTIDAITPLRAAKKMQGKFGGAGLLMQEAVGHSSGSTSSKCTWKFTTQYMKDGSLPAEGTLCQPDRLPFQNSTAKAMGGVMGRAVPVWR